MSRSNEVQTKKKSQIISENLQVPQTVARGTAFIELSGNSEAIIEGCKGVLEYSDDAIRLNIGKNEVKFFGTDLIVKSYFNEQVIIQGNILTIDFS
ncbi:MAG: YabP/YqfC family sporulation protein [Oscillospiraceae bacterium]